MTVKADLEALEESQPIAVMSKCKILNIPDMYAFNDPELVEICKKQYEETI